MVKTFQINGVEYAEYMSKTGYETEQVPVYAAKITTLDGIDHYTKSRAKSVLKIRTMSQPRRKLRGVGSRLRLHLIALRHPAVRTR